jgi:hypothetical protein
MPYRFKHYVALLGSCALLSLSACGSDPQRAESGKPGDSDPAAGGSSVAENVGSIELGLQLGGAQLDSMSYTIVGSGFTTSGSLDVSHSSKVSGLIGGIPFGSNYALTMSGKGASSTPLDCSGSASFNLNSVGPEPVTIPITCKEPEVAPPIPAPVPPLAVFSLACLLAVLGFAAQRRTARG